jgi:polysaccharide biosynthesis protein PelA
LNGPLKYACYYGRGRLLDLAAYDLVILESAGYFPEEVAYLRSCGVCVTAYLSIGSEANPGTGRDWHMIDPVTGCPDGDPRWDGLWVDCGSPAWQTHVLDESIPAILGRGFQGLLLDNLDVQESHSETRSGVIELVQRIRTAYPGLMLIGNRGFSVLDALLPTVDAILFEAFTTYHDGDRYAAWSEAGLAWTEDKALWLRSLGHELAVFALDYAAPRDFALRHLAKSRALVHGFPSFVSTRALDWLPALEDNPI